MKVTGYISKKRWSVKITVIHGVTILRITSIHGIRATLQVDLEPDDCLVHPFIHRCLTI